MTSTRIFNNIPWRAEVEDTSSEDDDELEEKMKVKSEQDELTPAIPCVVLQPQVDFAPPSLNVTLATLKHMFSKKNVWERAHVFTCGVLQIPIDSARTVHSHALYKGFRKQLYKLLREEYNLIKRNIRLLQRRHPVSKKPHRLNKPRPLSRYAVYCRELRATRPHEEIVGKMQELWKQRKQEIRSMQEELSSTKRVGVYGLKRPYQPQKQITVTKDISSDEDSDSEMEDNSN